MANIKQASPPLLGHHSEKVHLLWDKVKEKDLFCDSLGYSRNFIERTINGKQKGYTNRVHNLIQDLVTHKNISSVLKTVRPIQYRFLHPLTIR